MGQPCWRKWVLGHWAAHSVRQKAPPVTLDARCCSLGDINKWGQKLAASLGVCHYVSLEEAGNPAYFSVEGHGRQPTYLLAGEPLNRSRCLRRGWKVIHFCEYMFMPLWIKMVRVPLQVLSWCGRVALLSSRGHGRPENTTILSTSVLFLNSPSQPLPRESPGPGSVGSFLILLSRCFLCLGGREREDRGWVHPPPSALGKLGAEAVLGVGDTAAAVPSGWGEAQGPNSDIQEAAEWLSPTPRRGA